MNFAKAFSIFLMLTMSGMQQTGDDEFTIARSKRFESRKEFDEHWAKVKDIRHLEDPNLITDLEPEELWLKGMVQSHGGNLELSDHLSREELSSIIKEIVEEFGHSEALDLRIMLDISYYFDPEDFQTFPNGYKNEFRRWLAMKFAEHQTRDWCKHPEKVERLVWFKAWEKRWGMPMRFWYLRTDMKVGLAKGGLKPKDGDEYWKHAKSFIYLATASNRTDLFAGKNPEELKPQIDEWLAWTERLVEQKRIRPSELSPTWVEIPESLPATNDVDSFDFKKSWVVPPTPFPRWRIPTEPISAELFNDLT